MTYQEAQLAHKTEERVTVSGGDYEGHGGRIIACPSSFRRAAGPKVMVLFDTIPWKPWISIGNLTEDAEPEA